MPHIFTTIIGKSVRKVAKARGGGSALPGLVVEKINPNFINKTLSQLPMGVVVISGTNGKTTTTKMVVSLLEAQGLKVFTNKTGSNFARGVIAELLEDIKLTGKLDFDIAVLELDEAHAVKFVEKVKPSYSLLLNVMRDQLDRFGEIDTTAKMLQKIAESTKDTVVINSQDNRLIKIAQDLNQNVQYYGLNNKLTKYFPNDDQLHGNNGQTVNKITSPIVNLSDFKDNYATFDINNKKYSTNLKINGIYNIFNAAGALALVSTIIPNANPEKLISALSEVRPAFGRGETIDFNGTPVDLVLVKNPAGFRLGLSSFDNKNHDVMIAINDKYADGRDVSWLWDVDFSSLKSVPQVTGARAYDMALRLESDNIGVHDVNTDISTSLKSFLKSNPSKAKRIYCTYTAMLLIRKELSKVAEIEAI